MLIIAIISLILSLAFSIFVWIMKRPGKWIYPSDILMMGSLALVGLPPLFYDRNNELAIQYSYNDVQIAMTIFGIAIMLGSFGFVWMFRKRIDSPSIMAGAVTSPDNVRFILFLGAAVVAMALLLMLEPLYFQFKIEVIKFLTGQIGQSEYQLSRRVTFQHDKFVDPLTGRIQYSVEAFIFSAIGAMLFKKYNFVLVIPVLVAYFVFIPAGLQKATIVIYLLYAVLAYMLVNGKVWFLKFRNIVPIVIAAVPTVLILVTLLFFYQYKDSFKGIEDLPKAFSLAVFRVLSAIYVALLQYFVVYTDVMPKTGLHDSSIYCVLAGCDVRNPSAEVPTYLLGEQAGQLTSFPTIFIGAAYAEFGYIGIIVYSFAIAAYAVLIDRLVYAIKDTYIRIAYYSVMIVNMLFMCQLQALTVMLTYGLGVIPVVAIIADRIKFTSPPTRLISRPSPSIRKSV